MPYKKCDARTELKPIFCLFYILYTFSILLQNGEEIGMKKDRLFLLDETVVPASLTQLREVTSTITTQIVIFHFKIFTFSLVKEYLLSFKFQVSTCFLEYLKDDNLNRMWSIHSSHRKKKLQSDNLKTASRRAIFLNWLLTMPLARLLMFLTLFLIYYSILRDDSLYVFSLIFVPHFNLLPFCFSEIKKRGSISVFSSYWRRRVGRLCYIPCLFFNFKISRKF